jgi:PadR family transcriptional regulator PadR
MRRKAGALVSTERSILESGLALHALGTAEFHGYSLAKEMREHAGARRLVSHGTLYKALDRLESAGLLQSRWEDPHDAAHAGRPRRRLYHVTAAGTELLAKQPAEPVLTTLVVQPESG